MLIVLDRAFLLIPYNIALDIGKFFGGLIFILLGKYRRLTKNHLRSALGASMDEKEISRIAQSVFVNLAMGFTEVLSLPKIKNRLDTIIELKGVEKVDKILQEGKGMIAVSGHLGNWELIPMYFAYRGYSSNVVARPVYYEKYDEWVSFLRKSMGVNVIYRTDSPKKLLRLLKDNEILGILADQDIDSIEGVFVDFFGKKARTSTAPVKLAMASGAPIVPIFIIRNGKKHTMVVEDPIRVERSVDREKAVLSYTQIWSDVLESYIRKYPQQWVWMHRRWKSRPPQSTPSYNIKE